VFLILIAIAITRHHLLGIKVALTELLVGITAILLLVDLFFSTSFSEYLWRGTMVAGFLILGYLLIKISIRETKQRDQLEKAHRQLGLAYEKLQRIDQLKSEFISIVSHQLKGPLGVTKNYLWMILNKKFGAVPEKILRPLKILSEVNERLIKIVNDLLNLSRIELGRIKLQKQCFDWAS